MMRKLQMPEDEMMSKLVQRDEPEEQTEEDTEDGE